MSYFLMDDYLGMETSFEERIIKLNEILSQSKRIVFFGGAGVSTGSGIPDFRSNNGLYNNVDEKFTKYTPEYYLSSDCFHHNPKLFYAFYKQYMDCRNYEPNICHKKLAELEQMGKLTGIITQNIDTLHEKAGSQKVFKIHGTVDKNTCIKCHKEFGIDYIFDSNDTIVKCDCKKEYNLVKPNVVLYGENLPIDATNKAFEVLEEAEENDCLIIAGTSLTVYPANTYVSMFKGKNLIIINKEPTNFDQFATILFRENIIDVFERINIKE